MYLSRYACTDMPQIYSRGRYTNNGKNRDEKITTTPHGRSLQLMQEPRVLDSWFTQVEDLTGVGQART